MAADDNRRLRRLKRQATRTADQTDARTEALALRLKGFLNRHLREALSGVGSDATAAEGSGALADLESHLTDAGLKDELHRVRELFEGTLADTAEDFTDTTGYKAPLGGVARESLEALVDDRLEL